MNQITNLINKNGADAPDHKDAHKDAGCTGLVCYPRRSEWQNLDPKDPNFVHSVIVIPTEGEAKTIRAHHFRSTALNSSGEILHTKIRTIQIKPVQDVVHTIAWYRDGNETKMVAVERNRPALAARPLLGAPKTIPENGMQVTLPGRYFVEEAATLSISDVVNQTLIDHGLDRKGKIHIMGGSYSPIPDSPELVFPRMIEIKPPHNNMLSNVGDHFWGRRTLVSFKCTDIINSFLGSELFDLRLLLAGLRFLALSDQELELESGFLLHKPTMYKPGNLKIPVYDKSDLRNLPGNNPFICGELQTEACNEPPGLPYITAKSFIAQNVNLNGSPVGSEYNFDLIVREFPDIIANLPYCFIDNKLMVLVNAGIRDADVERNAFPHPIYTNLSPLSLEGVFSGVLNGTHASELQELAKTLLNKWGLENTTDPVYHGSGTASSSFDALAYHLFTSPINPENVDFAKLPKTSFLVDSEDVLALAQTGEVRSLELILGVMLLRARFGLSLNVSENLVGEKKEILDFEDILSGPSRTMSKLARGSQRIFDLLMRSSEGRNLLNFLDNNAEYTIVQSRSPEELGLFDGVLRITSEGAPENASEEGMLNFHDALGHFVRRKAPIPFRQDKEGNLLKDSEGKLIPWEFEEYKRALLIDEADALWMSEVKIPQIVGLNEFEVEAKKPCMARFFEAAGIHGDEAEKKAIRIMVVEGRIPPELAKHSDYVKYRDVILAKFLGYYVRDGERNAQLLYDAWMVNPEHARVIAPFIDPIEAPPVNVLDYHLNDFDVVLSYHNGRNPLRGYISDIRGQGTSRTLSQLAALAQKYAPQSPYYDSALHKECLDLAKSLAQGYKELGELREQIIDVEKNTFNFKIYQRAKEILQTCYHPAEVFCANHWPKDQRHYPAATIHPFFLGSDLIPRVHGLESRSLVGTRNKFMIEAGLVLEPEARV